MRSRLLLFLITLFLLTLTPGCWDIKDVNNTTFAITLGIDKPNNPKAKYLVTLEFAKPVPGQNEPTPKSMVTSVEADSILQAIQSIQTDISRQISLTHLRVIVIGEEIAKEKDFKDLTNYLMREPKVAWRLRLVFVEGSKAQELFDAKHNFQQLVGTEVVQFAETQKQLSLVRTNNFLDFVRNLNRTKGTALGSRVAIIGEEKVLTRDGAAVYKNWKLAT